MLIDTFQFFNELDILELRFRALDKYVDKFILVESPETHNGNPKPLFFEDNRDRFAPWMDKIIHVIAPKCASSGIWDREKHQRECILMGIPEDLPDDAHIMVSDADEIPDMSKIVLSDKKTQVVHMFMFEYSFDFLFTGEPWFGTVITTAKAFKKLGPNFFRDNRWKFDVLQWSGWHCSSFGTAEHVWNKIQNYAHALDAKHSCQTIEDFKRYVSQGVHSDGASKLVPRPEGIPLPPGWEVFKGSMST